MICISIDVAVDKFINLHRAVSSSRTVKYYEENLQMFKDFAELNEIIMLDEFSQDNFLEYLQMLRYRDVKNTTVNTYTRALRVFANWAVNNDYLDKSFCAFRYNF